MLQCIPAAFKKEAPGEGLAKKGQRPSYDPRVRTSTNT